MSEEKVVCRGESWWVDSGIGVGSEEKFGRPGVIVSSDVGNRKSPTVLVAYTTTQPMHGDLNPKIRVSGRTKWVRCNQIATVDKTRLVRKDGVLSPEDMVKVEAGLAIAMGVATKSAPEQKPDDTALRCECDMWKRMYETVMAQLVEMRVAADMARRVAVVEEPKSVEKKPPMKKSAPLSVDINYCSESALRELGLSDADVASVIACRPFESVLELNCVPDLDSGWVAANEHRFVCTPIVIEQESETAKVNLNTCGGKDLMALGINKTTAYRITSHRKQNGPFALISDLLRVKGVSQKFVDTWADKLEV